MKTIAIAVLAAATIAGLSMPASARDFNNDSDYGHYGQRLRAASARIQHCVAYGVMEQTEARIWRREVRRVRDLWERRQDGERMRGLEQQMDRLEVHIESDCQGVVD